MTRSELAFDDYDYHEQYYSINTGVHRKGGVELVTPTLAHHVGLWYPSLPDAGGRKLSVARFGPQIDECVGTLYAAMRKLPDFESNFTFIAGEADIVCLFGGAYRVSADGELALCEPNALPGHSALRDAMESDNRILFMKGSWHGLAIVVRCEFRSEYATVTRFVTLEDAAALHPSVADLPAALGLLTRLGRQEACSEDDIVASYITLYGDHWESIDHELFGKADLFRIGNGADRSRIFADFRGVVLAGSDADDTGTISLSSIKDCPERGRPFAHDWPSACLIPSIWPFMTARNGLDLKRREFTASFMLDKRAVYITALGPQPAAGDSLRCAPLHYVLVARPVSDWQLGALVDRLHFMGTVRLAALMEMKALREAGANLRDMEHEAEAARSAIDAGETEIAVRHYQRAMELIAHKSGSGAPIFWAGLQFRVERSRYYVQRFDELVPFLGIEPVDGYQRYHYFVKARLGSVYDYIDRLGVRQERAVKSAEGIYQLLLLKSVAEANAQNSRISRTIEKLQTKAEIGLLAVIVPHYLMGIVRDFHEVRKETGLVHAFWAILVVGILLASTSLGAYLKDRAAEREFKQIESICVKYGILLVLALGVFAVAFNTDR